MPAIAAGMDADRQACCFRGGVDRPVFAPPERFVRTRRNVDLDVPSKRRAAFDFRNRRHRIVLAHQDRRLQAGIGPCEELVLPFVDGVLQRRAELQVHLREDAEVEHLQNSELDVERIEMLLLHEGEIGARRSAGRRPGVAPRDQWRRARVGRRRGERIADVRTERLQVLLPAFWQERVQVVARMQRWMDVAIDDLQPGPRVLLRRRAVIGAIENVGHFALLQAFVCRRGNVSSGFSAHMRLAMDAGICAGIGSSPSNCQCG